MDSLRLGWESSPVSEPLQTDEQVATPPGRARRRRARRGEGPALREEILQAAERLLIETGDQEAVSIRAVAQAVGVTPPSIYLHFADKNDLVFAVCERAFARFDAVQEEAAAQSDDPLESLMLRGRAYVRFGLENPEQYRILFMTRPSGTPHSWTPETIAGIAAFWHLVEAVQRCMDAGALTQGDPVVYAIGCWSSVHGITSLLLSHPQFPWPEHEELIDHILLAPIEGLRPKG